MSVDYSNLRFLVIDDFDNFRATVSKMLDEFGCRQVVSEVNGKRAIQACQHNSFDVVLCDYNLGQGPNGQQVLETLRERQWLSRKSLFLLVSAETSKSVVLSAYDYQPDAYLTKPITPATLKKRLDRLLAQRQVLLPVYEALDRNEVAWAVELLRDIIDTGTRYVSGCYQLLGELLQQLQLWDEAETVYLSVMENRPLDWARVGMAKVKTAQGDVDTATQWLESIIQANPFCMQAYDALAACHLHQNDSDQAQSVFQAAVEVSPVSIVRQKTLAESAYANRDFNVACKAYSRTLRLGEHSCHDCAHNHLQFVRSVGAFVRQEGTSAGSDRMREAEAVLERLGRRFELSPEQVLMSQCLQVQIAAGRGNQRLALDTLEALEQKLEQHVFEVESQVESHLNQAINDAANQPLHEAKQTPAEAKDSAKEKYTDSEPQQLDLDLQLDRVAALDMCNKQLQKDALLMELQQQYAQDDAALSKIDPWLAEPASKTSNNIIAKLNNQGIQFYNAKDYPQALQYLQKAARMFPNHVAVQLNLLQAQLGEIEDVGTSVEAVERCLSCLQRVELLITPQHQQFQRYRQLNLKVRSLRQ